MTTATKEKPIIFSGAMIRAILDGRKTQTRRVVKGPIEFIAGKGDSRDDPSNWGWADEYGDWHTLAVGGDSSCDESCRIPCPYGAPGSRLWVRETFRAIEDPGAEDDEVRRTYQDELGDTCRIVVDYKADAPTRIMDKLGKPEWKPSIHMPRWASRLTLEITEVRVERLGCLSPEDAVAEGVGSPGEFIELWKSIHGTWEPQAWTWVLQFRRL